MRILILNQYFEPDVAASARRLTELAEDLAAHHAVTVVAGRPSYAQMRSDGAAAWPPTLRVRRAPSTAFQRHQPLGRVVNYVTYLVAAFVLGLTAPKPHIVIAATDPPLVALVGRCLSLLRRVPFVHLLWDVQPQVAVAAGLLRRGRIASAIDALNRWGLRGAAIVVVPTASMKLGAIEAGASADRVVVAPLWEDTSVVAPLPRDNVFSRLHGLVDRFVVMYSGNMGLTQSLGVLLDVAARLRDLDDVVVVLVGDGASKARLQHEAENRRLTNVRFLPYQPRSGMASSLASADVFVVPLGAGLTRYMHPSKILTIMASGRPVIASVDRSSDTAELVEREGIGFVVDPGDAAGIERHLRWFHAHPVERREMGVRARAAAEARYARGVRIAQYMEALRPFEPVVP